MTPNQSTDSTPLCEEHRSRGDWNPLWDQLHEMDPEFMEAYLRLRSVPLRGQALSPKFKELILVAINAATTHLYAPGLRRHMRNALKHGASRQELLETIQLTTLLGIHSCNLAVPILAEELAAGEQRSEADGSTRVPPRS